MGTPFADTHRAYAGTFTDRVRGVTDWDAPAPVAGWTARSVVVHLLTWFPGLLSSGSELAIPAGPDPDVDPVAAWEHQRDAVQALLDDEGTAALPFTSARAPGLSVGEMVDRFYTVDVFMHTWDLARASGQDDRLDEAVATGILEGMRPIEDMLRASGHYGTGPGPLREGADATDRLMSFIGRDPYWSAP